MGFLEEVERVFEEVPDDAKIALFSATMPRPIQRIADRKFPDHVVIQVEESSLSTEHITQLYAMVPQRHKLDALLRILQAEPLGTTLVFCNTRRDCASVADELVRFGFAADALHGDMDQPARERVLARLRSGRLQIVVATDVAARGIHVDDVDVVIHHDPPSDAKTYVHRSGRTARAGESGLVVSLVLWNEELEVRKLMRRLGMKHPIVEVFSNDPRLADLNAWDPAADAA
jgi:superfamily II DNA/RNA helicase